MNQWAKKAASYTCRKVTHLRSLAGMKARWTVFFGLGTSPKDYGWALYKPPVDKRMADLQWSIVHGAIATNRHVAHLDPSVGKEFPFCLENETIQHLFTEFSV